MSKFIFFTLKQLNIYHTHSVFFVQNACDEHVIGRLSPPIQMYACFVSEIATVTATAHLLSLS
jgi:hypothetical protein